MAGKGYSFGKDGGGRPVGLHISADLDERMRRMCNILEMQRSALIRYLLTRGMDDLEAKLAERLERMREADEVTNRG